MGGGASRLWHGISECHSTPIDICDCSVGIDQDGVFVVSNQLDCGLCQRMHESEQVASARATAAAWVKQSPRFRMGKRNSPTVSAHYTDSDAVVMHQLAAWIREASMEEEWDFCVGAQNARHGMGGRAEVIINKDTEWIFSVPVDVMLTDLFASFNCNEKELVHQFDIDVNRQQTVLNGTRVWSGSHARSCIAQWKGVSTPTVLMCTQAVLGLPVKMLQLSIQEWNPGAVVLGRDPMTAVPTLEKEGALVAVRQRAHSRDICVQKKLYMCECLNNGDVACFARVVVQIIGTLPIEGCAMGVSETKATTETVVSGDNQDSNTFMLRFFVEDYTVPEFEKDKENK
jgi:hypothetical protein